MNRAELEALLEDETELAKLLHIRADRSRIQTRQRCPRERFLAYHYDGMGIAKKGAKYDAFFGQMVHDTLAAVLLKAKQTPNYKGEGIDLLIKAHQTKLVDGIKERMEGENTDHFEREQSDMLAMLVGGWCKYRLPAVIKEYEIVSVEQELEVVLRPEDWLPANIAALQRPLKLPLRMDCLLRHRQSGVLMIMDFKTARQASEDWNMALDNSLQSCLYIAATEQHYGEGVGGIWYEGLVKGYREMDKAKSSPFQGQIIQYGSPLYGWEKNGALLDRYTPGSMRVYVPSKHKTFADFLSWAERNQKLRANFPSTLPWRPLNIGYVLGATIVKENEYQRAVEAYNALPKDSSERAFYEHVLFEPHLDNCFKYGSKHPCQFVDMCHKSLHEDEIKLEYEQRVPHHTGEPIFEN